MVLAVGIGCWKLDATTQPWALQGRQESLAIPILHVGSYYRTEEGKQQKSVRVTPKYTP